MQGPGTDVDYEARPYSVFVVADSALAGSFDKTEDVTVVVPMRGEPAGRSDACQDHGEDLCIRGNKAVTGNTGGHIRSRRSPFH